MADLWYFTCEGKLMEPVTASELKQLASTGYLRGADLVWREGMPEWAKADSIPDLIPPAAPGSAPAPSDRAATRPESAEEGYDDVPRRRRRRADEGGAGADRPRRRREPVKGMSGLTTGLIIGGVALAAFVAIGAIVVVAVHTNAGVSIDNYTVDLKPHEFHARNLDFKFGTLYEFSAICDRVTDVDLVIEDANGQPVGGDISFGPNSFLQWSPAATGNYRVRLENLDDFQANRAHVAIRSIGTTRGPVGNGLPVAVQPKFPFPNFQGPAKGIAKRPGLVINPDLRAKKKGEFEKQEREPKNSVPIGLLHPNADWNKVVFFPTAKEIAVEAASDQRDNELDLFVYDDKDEKIASDDLRANECRTSFRAEANRSYRFRVVNLGPLPADCTLTYTQP